MWKSRVRTCIQKAIEELRTEAMREQDFDVTIRTELNQMVLKTRLEDHIKRLTEILAEIEATAEAPARKPEAPPR